MRSRVVAVLAVVVAVAAVSLAAWVRTLPGVPAQLLTGYGTDLPAGLLAVAWTVTGAVLVALRPRNALGWLVVGVGVCQGLQQGLAAYGGYGVAVAGWPLARWAAWLAAGLWLPGLLPLAEWLTRHPAWRSSAETARGSYAEGARLGAPDVCRPPTGSTCGRTWPRRPSAALPATATACARPHPSSRLRRRPLRRHRRWGGSPSAPDATMRWCTARSPRGMVCGHRSAPWLGSSHRAAVCPRGHLTGTGRRQVAPASSQQAGPVQAVPAAALGAGLPQRRPARPRRRRAGLCRQLRPGPRLPGRLPGQAQPRRAAPPTVRQVTDWLTRHPATLTEDDQVRLKAVLEQCPELRSAAGHVRAFGEMLTKLRGQELPAWIAAVHAEGLPGLTAFADSLTSDLDAVTWGLTTRWNSGPIEGRVNHIEMLKRRMFGRASPPLLRKRVLLTASR